MWTAEHGLTARVDPDAVWLRWVDPTYWPQDDVDVRAAGYDATPREHSPDRPTPSAGAGRSAAPPPGTTGWIKPAKSPMSHFTVIRVNRDEGRFDIQSRYPGSTMHVEHRLTPTQGAAAGTYDLVHRVRFSGPAAAVWGAVLGRSIVSGLPAVMTNIVEHAGGVVRV